MCGPNEGGGEVDECGGLVGSLGGMLGGMGGGRRIKLSVAAVEACGALEAKNEVSTPCAAMLAAALDDVGEEAEECAADG